MFQQLLAEANRQIPVTPILNLHQNSEIRRLNFAAGHGFRLRGYGVGARVFNLGCHVFSVRCDSLYPEKVSERYF